MHKFYFAKQNRKPNWNQYGNEETTSVGQQKD